MRRVNSVSIATPVVASLLLAFFSTASAFGQILVAVEDGIGAGGQGTVNQLNDDTHFDFTATLVNAAAIDTAGELAAYDVVVVGGSGGNNADWTAAMWAAVRAWVEAGGGIVATGWFNFEARSGDPGVADLEAIVPTQNIPSVDQWVSGATALDFSGPNHAVTNGLSNFAPGANEIEVNRFAAEANDTVLATVVGAANDISVAVKEAIGAGRSVYLGPLFMAQASYNPGPLRSGNPDRLLEQAVAWAAGPPVVTSASPDPVDWLQTLTITGNALGNASSVTVGGTAAPITNNTATQIDVTIADTTPTGAGQVVSVTTPLGVDNATTVTVNPVAPTVTGASPPSVAWLATLQIAGTALLATTDVTIGGIAASITNATSTNVTVVVSDSTPLGLQSVSLTTPLGSDTTTVTVTGIAPTITGAGPDPVEATKTLTITGTALANVTTATVGGSAATVQSNTANEVVLGVPSDAPLGAAQIVSLTTAFGTDTVLVEVLAPPGCCGMVSRDASSNDATLWLLMLALIPLAVVGTRRLRAC